MFKTALLCITLALSGSVLAATDAELAQRVRDGKAITYEEQQQLDTWLRELKKNAQTGYDAASADYNAAQERLDEPRMKDAADRMGRMVGASMALENLRYKALAATHINDKKKEPETPDLFGDLSSGKQSSAEKKAAADAKKKAASDKAASDKAASTRNTAPASPSVNISGYAAQIQQAITQQLHERDKYAGQRCTVKIDIARDGTLNAVTAQGGNPELCQAAIIAAKSARIPAAPNDEVWQAMKSATLEFWQ